MIKTFVVSAAHTANIKEPFRRTLEDKLTRPERKKYIEKEFESLKKSVNVTSFKVLSA